MRLVIVGMLALSVGSAHAADQKQFTVGEVTDMLAGLSSLDGYKDICKDGANEKECVKHYKFSVGALTSIALDIEAMRPIADAAQRAHNALIGQYGGDIPDKSKAAFTVDDAAIRDKAAPLLTLAPLTLDDLDLKNNPIQPGVLALIRPALTPNN